jgi:O-methyltransferase
MEDSQDKIKGLYLETLKRFITRYGFEPHGTWAAVGFFKGGERGWRLAAILAAQFFEKFFLPKGVTIALWQPFDVAKRRKGLDWPLYAETMIGLERLNQFHSALEIIEEEKIPGNILEAGVWRGGAVIFAAQFLNVWQIEGRSVYAADSFQGLPRPEKEFPADNGDVHHNYDFLSVSLEEVKENFSSYLVPTENGNVVFVEGFFAESLQNLDCGPLAILRMDGDMYSSTIHTLDSLFDKVSPGGFVIVDDWFLPGARAAVKDFLSSRNLTLEIHEIDGSGAFFRLPK